MTPHAEWEIPGNCRRIQVLFKIDIPANRYDMLCLEGIARALNIFNRRLRGIDYRLADMTGADGLLPRVNHVVISIAMQRTKFSVPSQTGNDACGSDRARRSKVIMPDPRLRCPCMGAAAAKVELTFVWTSAMAFAPRDTGQTLANSSRSVCRRQATRAVDCEARDGARAALRRGGDPARRHLRSDALRILHRPAGQAAPEPVPATQPGRDRHPRPGATPALQTEAISADCAKTGSQQLYMRRPCIRLRWLAVVKTATDIHERPSCPSASSNAISWMQGMLILPCTCATRMFRCCVDCTSLSTHLQGKLVPPFTYEALPPADIEFVPLKQTRCFRADALMQAWIVPLMLLPTAALISSLTSCTHGRSDVSTCHELRLRCIRSQQAYSGSFGDVPLRGPCVRAIKRQTSLRCCAQHYEAHDLKLRRFVPIIRDSVVYPVILDSRRTVCSLPPIINGAMPAVCPEPSALTLLARLTLNRGCTTPHPQR